MRTPALVAALLVAAPAAAAPAAPVCAPYDLFLRELPRWEEALIDAEIVGDGPARLEFWARPDRRSWSVLLVLPSGPACIVGAGGDAKPGEGT